MSKRIWTFGYEPESIDEMILNDGIKSKLKKAIKEVPNLFLIGPAGVGKGTFTNIYLKETEYDFLKFNGSDETGIDNMRMKVKPFATALGTSDLKIVVINECDYISRPAQAMLRDLMEQVQSITRFVFQCNYEHLIIPELFSRCQVVHINHPPAKDIYAHCMKILKSENIVVKNKASIVETIKKLYPDIRGIINTLQLNTIDGVIDRVKIEEINEAYNDIKVNMLSKDLNKIRNILRSNTVNYPELYNFLFECVTDFKSPGDMIIEIGKHLYQDNSVAIKEINFMAMVAGCLKHGYI